MFLSESIYEIALRSLAPDHFPRSPESIIGEAIGRFRPVRMFVGMSGGNDSMTVAHWMMNNVPGCEVLHINTGIGIERTRQFVRDVCRDFGWPLTEVRAKEDCGQHYDDIVKEYGFPGPSMHRVMYARLKERCVRKVVRESKRHRNDKVLIATGIYREESKRRAGYAGRVVNTVGAQLWVNPLYFWSASDMRSYRLRHNLPVNPVSELLGMSGECLCGAFAHKGEKQLVKVVCPTTYNRIDALEREMFALGYDWGWEDKPPSKQKKIKAAPPGPLCMGCEKHFTEVQLA